MFASTVTLNNAKVTLHGKTLKFGYLLKIINVKDNYNNQKSLKEMKNRK